MNPIYHIILSSFVFGFLYLMGFPSNFVLLAFFASILVDVDHFALGRFIGSYNPIEIYKSCCITKEIEKTFTPKGLMLKRWFDVRFLPFHNLFLNAILLIFLFPVGIGVLLHNILDGVDYTIFNLIGGKSGFKKP